MSIKDNNKPINNHELKKFDFDIKNVSTNTLFLLENLKKGLNIIYYLLSFYQAKFFFLPKNNSYKTLILFKK